MGAGAVELPAFTLYADGTVIYRGRNADPLAAGPGAALPPLRMAKMDQEQIDALVRFALGPGRLAGARARYENMTVADAPTTVFSIDAGGVTKSVSVYALGINDEQSRDREDLAGFAELARTLGDFGAQVERGNATDAGTYEPERYRAVLFEGAQSQGNEQDWPWDDVSLGDFRAPDGQRATVLTADQAKKLHPTPQGGLFSASVTGPDGKPYVIALRPLLPDEES